MELATHKLGLLNQSAVAGTESLAELRHSARLGKTFPVGWVVGWQRKAENKAKAQHSWGLGLGLNLAWQYKLS